MNRKFLTLFSLSLFSIAVCAEIPDWYKRDIVTHIQKADGIIVYKVMKVTFVSTSHIYYSYRIDTETLNELKGKAPKGECYMIHTEGEWSSPYKVGDKAIVILNVKYTGECGAIESGFGAPATQEYIELYNSILTKSPNQKMQSMPDGTD